MMFFFLLDRRGITSSYIVDLLGVVRVVFTARERRGSRFAPHGAAARRTPQLPRRRLRQKKNLSLGGRRWKEGQAHRKRRARWLKSGRGRHLPVSSSREKITFWAEDGTSAW